MTLTGYRKILDTSTMEEICSHNATALAVAAAPLNAFGYSIDTALNTTLSDLVQQSGLPPDWSETTACNHLIYLVHDGCFLGPEGNIFKVWTWGQYRYATLDTLIYGGESMLCAAM